MPKIDKGKKQCSRFLGYDKVEVDYLLKALAEVGMLTGHSNAKIAVHEDRYMCYECSGGKEVSLLLEWEEDFTPAELKKQEEQLAKQKEKAKARRKRDWKRLNKEFGDAADS